MSEASSARHTSPDTAQPAPAGSVVLVGAGPGDPGLITVRGVEALRSADAVVYDYLAAPDLLRYARNGAELHYVGKRAGQHTLRQGEINRLLVELATAGRRVVRLKGGDPFVFGRGGEEIEALVQAGIPFGVVPGVTSAISVPAYAGIPVTHRGLASSFTVITGHEDPTKPNSVLDWSALARVDTLVVVMGVGNLGPIVAELIRNGKPSTTPAALIERGTVGVQRTVTGVLDDIVDRALATGIQAPAIAVIGDVVGLRSRLAWFDLKPLHGLRILVTRTRDQAGKLSAALRASGAEPVECPLIETVPPADWTPLDAAIERLPTFDWVVFTSANGVEAFWGRLELAELDARALAGCRIAAIGPATAAALAARGLRADWVPDEHVAEAVAEGIGEVRGLRVLLARAEKARPVLAERLSEAGAIVEEVTAYRTVRPAGLGADLRERLGEGVDVVTFTSSSTVQHFVEALGAGEAAQALDGVSIACIGPITAETARRYSLTPSCVATEYTIDGLVQALILWRRGRQGQDETTQTVTSDGILFDGNGD